ncbi:hypothetical protein AB0911_38070 [Streptomyces nigra]
MAGHDDRFCRNIVKEQRCRAEAVAAAVGKPPPPLPDLYGRSWPRNW